MADEVDLFVYGTLMNESVLYSLTGRYFPRYEAELSGFERFLPHNGYPYVIPNPRARVQGILLTGIDPTALAALDRYEEALSELELASRLDPQRPLYRARREELLKLMKGPNAR